MRKLALLLLLAAGTVQAANVEVIWTQPTTNEDSSPIPATGPGSIASNRVEWGSCAGTGFGTKVAEKVVTPAATSTTVPNLGPQTWCFRVYATNTYGVESNPSGVASRIVTPPKPSAPTITTATVVRLWIDGKPSLVAGKVAIGVECGEAKSETWSRISRDDVRLNFVGKVASRAPLVAKCAAA